jgi:hypothetical protein
LPSAKSLSIIFLLQSRSLFLNEKPALLPALFSLKLFITNKKGHPTSGRTAFISEP